MGCDIHTCLEDLCVIDEEEIWVSRDLYLKDSDFGLSDNNNSPFRKVDVYNTRNYSLFSMLAGVRRRSYEDSPLLSEPRGLPHDCSPETLASSEYWGANAHSHSYCTLEELIEFEKNNRKIKYSGFVSIEEAKKLDEEGTAPQIGKNTDSKDVVWREWSLPNDHFHELIQNIKQQCQKTYCYSYISNPQRIRLVFWFDN